MVSIVLFMLVALAVAAGVLYLTHAWEGPGAADGDQTANREADQHAELADGGSR